MRLPGLTAFNYAFQAFDTSTTGMDRNERRRPRRRRIRTSTISSSYNADEEVGVVAIETPSVAGSRASTSSK